MDPSKISDLYSSQTFWREGPREVWAFYCPLCRSVRKLPYRPKPGGARHWAQVTLAAAFFTLVTWQWFTWKGIVAIVPFWTIFEVAYRMRVRAAVSCPQCGFDPFLYRTDVKRARREIESHWRRRFAEKGIPYPEKGGHVARGRATEAKGPAPGVLEEGGPDSGPEQDGADAAETSGMS